MTIRRAMLLTGGLALLAVPFLFWLVMLSPLTYEYPEDWQMPDHDTTHTVFVYGTLKSAPLRWLVMGRAGQPAQYTLQGYERQGLDITENPDASVEGLLLEVSAGELRKLDRYERIGIRYERVQILRENGSGIWVYRRL
ncbi:MAG: gamma-glutamylcyclotransferase family protein [Pseudohongiellaceae bacterium]